MNTGTRQWALVGGVALTFMAAAVNVYFLITVGFSVSHLTGDVSAVAADLLTVPAGEWNSLRPLALAISGFFLGAVLGGYILHNRALHIERPYGRSVRFIGALILIAAFIPNMEAALVVAAVACGFQNGLATRYRGLILRTTHITGVITDFGHMIGMRIAGHQVESWKILVQVSIAVAFAIGSLFGAALHHFSPDHALILLGTAYLLGGTAWSVFKRIILKSSEEVSQPPV